MLYALLRLAIQVFLFSDVMRPEAVAQGVQVGADLQQSLFARLCIFRTAPTPALRILLPIMVGIHLLAYGLLYIRWDRIFEQNNLPYIARQWAHLTLSRVLPK